MKKYLIIAMLKTLRDEIENKSYIDALDSVDEIFEELEKIPQKLEPLSEHEILSIINSINEEPLSLDDLSANDWNAFIELCRAIEKSHGIE
ncbi:MAG: hypothetical protein PHR19_02395 [Bacteroidales bacterium]|nr:hypothetical protein [Bacteroidales bacterium]